MDKQELIYLSQEVALQASPLTNDTCVYVATESPEHEYELMKRLTAIAYTTINMIEEIHRQKFSTQVTEHVKAVEKGMMR